MNRIIRSRLSGIAVLLIVSMAVVGCNATCDICHLTCGLVGNIIIAYICILVSCPECLSPADPAAISQFCEENPDECTATFEQIQTAAIQFCEASPQECNDLFDSWVELFDTDAEE